MHADEATSQDHVSRATEAAQCRAKAARALACVRCCVAREQAWSASKHSHTAARDVRLMRERVSAIRNRFIGFPELSDQFRATARPRGFRARARHPEPQIGSQRLHS